MRRSSKGAIHRLREAADISRRLLGPKPRDLQRELKKQSTEDYWRGREKSKSRRSRLASYRHRLNSLTAGTLRNIGFVRNALLPILKAFGIGTALFTAVVSGEFFLAYYFSPGLIPSGDSNPPLSAFPSLAVQVSASLLGFYLASVSIVLGMSYHNVSAEVRTLVMGSPRTRFYLASVGMAIGAGLTIVLLGSLGVSYGYLTIIAYGLLVIFSGWAFIRLAFGAFNLFNPAVLAQEPLLALYEAIKRIDSTGLHGNEELLRVSSQEANRALRVLAELIDLTSDRVSIDRGRLAGMVENLLTLVQFYVQRKHMLTPTSAWFPREPAYPKWVEADHNSTSLALTTSTPLQPRLDPSLDWLERRSADLASAAVEACVNAKDRDSALRITNAAAATAHVMARYYRIDDAVVFSGIIKTRCWNIQSESPAATAVAAAPPLILANLLLGWREAILGWPDEIREVVDATKWDRRRTAMVPIRGPERVWTVAQRLLLEVKAEREIQGRRITPNWYLRFALADVCIFSLREFAKELPKYLDDFLVPTPAPSSPEVNAMIGSQALQAVAKAQLTTDVIPQAVEGLENLRMENDRQQIEEFECLSERVKARRSGVLKCTAEALTQLRPDQSKAEPDLFGEALFTLIHHAEEAIATGDVPLVKEVFPKILFGTAVLQEYVLSTYQPPTYQVNSTLLDPTIDILELSGLSMIYAALRGDQSDEPIREAWENYLRFLPQPDKAAKRVLDTLDIADGIMSSGITPRSVTRSSWDIRLSNHIIKAGYAIPRFNPFEGGPTWNAPPIIKMLGVLQDMPSIMLKPSAIFAAEVIGPLTGEPEDILRGRRGLHRYFSERDRHVAREESNKAESTDTEVEHNGGNLP